VSPIANALKSNCIREFTSLKRAFVLIEMKSLFAIQLFSPNPRSSKKIYGSVWNQASLEYRRYYFLWMRNFINISWISKRGKSVGFSHSTHVYLIPSNIGFDFILRPQKKVSLFYGFGVGACYEHFKDKSPYVKEISTLWSGSFLGRAGATFYPTFRTPSANRVDFLKLRA
jgi:hypothetical protein